MIYIAPDVDEILKVFAEDCPIDASLARKNLRLAVGMGHHHLLVHRTIGIGSKIGVTRLLIVAIDRCHHIFISNDLPQQLAVQVVEIEMIVAVALTGQENILIRDLHIREHVFLDIFVNLILDSQLADC